MSERRRLEGFVTHQEKQISVAKPTSMELTFRNRGETKIFSDERVSTCKEILKEVIKIEKKVIGKKHTSERALQQLKLKENRLSSYGDFFSIII